MWQLGIGNWELGIGTKALLRASLASKLQLWWLRLLFHEDTSDKILKLIKLGLRRPTASSTWYVEINAHSFIYRLFVLFLSFFLSFFFLTLTADPLVTSSTFHEEDDMLWSHRFRTFTTLCRWTGRRWGSKVEPISGWWSHLDWPIITGLRFPMHKSFIEARLRWEEGTASLSPSLVRVAIPFANLLIFLSFFLSFFLFPSLF
jgi:hypothetical protein